MVSQLLIVGSLTVFFFLFLFGLLLFTRLTRERQEKRRLFRQHELLEDITGNLPAMVYQLCIDADGIYGFNFVNKKPVDMLELDAPLASFFTAFTQCIHADDKAHFFKSIENAEKNKIPWHFEGRFVKPSGTQIWIACDATPHQNGGQTLFNGVIMDITKRKLTEEKLRTSEQLMSQIVNFLPNPTLVVDSQRHVIAWNHAMEDLTHVKADAILGKGNYEYALPFYGMRRPIMIDLVDRWDGEVAKNYSYIERKGNILISETKEHYPLLVKGLFRNVAGPLYDDRGTLIGAIESIHDVTDSRQAIEALREREELLGFFVTYTPVAVAMLDLQMNYLHYSRRWITDFNLPDEDLTGRCHYDVFGPMPEHWKAEHYRCLQGESFQKEEEAFQRADGSVEWVRRILYPWRRRDDKIGGLIILAERTTGKRQAQQAAHEMEQRLKTIGDNLPGGLIFQSCINPDGSRPFTYISGNVEHFFGVTASQVLANADLLFEKILPEDRKRMFDAESQAIQSLSVLDLLIRVRRRSGKIHWQRLVAKPRRLSGGAVLLDGIVIDMTPLKEAEANLTLMERVVEHSPVVLFRWEAETRRPVSYVSKNIEQFGYSPAELLSGAIPFDSLIHPGDRLQVALAVQQHTMAGDTHFQQEYRIITKSGEIRWVDDRSVVERDGDGRVSHYQGVVLDISERKRDQEEIHRRQIFLESVLYHAPDAIITLNDRRQVVDWNPGAETIFGYTRKAAIGKHLSALVGGEDAKSQVENNIQVALAGQRVESFETVRYHKDGSPIRVLVCGSPIIIDENLTGIVVVYTDITVLKQIEDERRKQERMLRRIMDMVPSMIFVKNADGRFLMANQAVADSYGMRVEEVVGKIQRDLHPDPNQVAHYQADDRQAILSGRKLVKKDEPFTDHTGTMRWLEVTKLPCDPNDFGEPAVVGLAMDVTERRQVEGMLRISQFSFDKAAIGIYWIRSDARIVNVNEHAARMLGYSPAELSSLTIFDIDADMGKEEYDTIWKKAVKHGSLVLERLHRHKSGSLIPVEIFSNHLEYNGEVFSIAFVQDITERKRALEELQRLRNYLSNIIDSMPSVLIGVDREMRVTQWNRQAEKQTGLTFEKAHRQPLDSVFPRLADELIRIQTAIKDRQVLRNLKIPRQQEGTTLFEDITIFPLEADGAEGAVIRLDDVTEQVHMEEMMIQGEKMLSVGGLAAGMAHEINNPLAGILQNTAVLENRLFGDLPANHRAAEATGINLAALRQYLEMRSLPIMLENIRSSGNRAAAIVRNMLSFARKSDRVIANHDLGTLLNQTIELAQTDYDMKKHYDFKQIQIVREYSESTPPVPCESSKIQQVFLNILKNGAEAMVEQTDKNKPPTFILRVKDDDPWVRVEIEDNGPGLDEANRRRIFEPFFTTKPIGKGTGLGLSVSYFIITENHGGKMEAHVADDGGTRFIIQLPKNR